MVTQRHRRDKFAQRPRPRRQRNPQPRYHDGDNEAAQMIGTGIAIAFVAGIAIMFLLNGGVPVRLRGVGTVFLNFLGT